MARALPPGRRGVAFGLLGTGLDVGRALGPVIGGFAAELGAGAPLLGTSVLVVPGLEPLHDGAAVGYSDGLLLIAVVLAAAVPLAAGLPGRSRQAH